MPRVYGKDVDIIEAFEYHVLVQEPKGGAIYLVPICDLEREPLPSDNIDESEPSNIISLEGWIECQKNQEAKQALSKSKIKKKSKPKSLLSLLKWPFL